MDEKEKKQHISKKFVLHEFYANIGNTCSIRNLYMLIEYFHLDSNYEKRKMLHYFAESEANNALSKISAENIQIIKEHLKNISKAFYLANQIDKFITKSSTITPINSLNHP